MAKDGTTVPPQPIIYVLTSDDVLLLYHVASCSPTRPSLIKSMEPCSIVAAKNGNPPAGYQPRSAGTTTPVKAPTSGLFGPPSTNVTPVTTSGFFGTGSDMSTPVRAPANGLFGGGASSTATPPATTSGFFGTSSDNATPVKAPTTGLFGATSTGAGLFGPKPSATSLDNKETQPETSLPAAANSELEKVKKEAEERAKKEAEEMSRKADEQEKQRRAAEEEQKRREAEAAERNRRMAEEEMRKKQQNAILEGNFKASLEILVSKLNEYARAVNALHSVKLKLMENVKFQVEYDGHLEPMLKSMGYVGIIGNDIAESLTRLRQVSNAIQRSAKESQQCLKKGNSELPTPEWVLELVCFFLVLS